MSENANPTPDANPATTAMNSRRFRIPGDVVNKATADLPDDQRSAIRWLHAHGAENDLSLGELGQLVRYDESTLHRVFWGKYEGNLANVVREIESFRKLHEERQKGRKLDFVETAMTRKIWDVCRAALEFQKVAFIFGETQTGKTTALLRYKDDHNHGETIYVRMPAGGAFSYFLASMAKALRISTQAKEKELVRRIKESFDSRMLLIIDEAHQVVIGSTRTSLTMEFIRELHDDSGCGLVICGTNVFRDEMETGRLAGILKQLRRRRLCPLQLPAQPTTKDLNTFAAAYKLPPATGEALKLQTDVIRDEALGMWLTLLRMGAKLANVEKKPMRWDHVIRASDGLKLLEGK